MLAPFYLAPLLATHLLPSFDLPHHLAIADALLKSTRPDSPYASYFDVRFGAAPFALHFLVLTTLGRWMSLTLAARVLVGGIVLLLPLAAARLLTAAGRPRFLAVLAFPLVCAMPLHFGFIAFVTALPLLVWMLALAMDEQRWRAAPARSAGLLAGVAVLTFFAHLEAWAIGVVASVAALLVLGAGIRTRLVALGALVPSSALAAWYLMRNAAERHADAAPSFVEALIRARLQEASEQGLWWTVASRFTVLHTHLLRGFVDGSDLVAALALWAVVAVGLVAALAMRRTWRPVLTPSFAVAVAVLLAYLGLPHHALPDAFSVYPRFAGVLLITCLPMMADWRPWSSAVRRSAAALVVLALVGIAVNLRAHYVAFANELADFDAIVTAAPNNRSSAGLVFDRESTVMDVGGLLSGIPAYYVTERPGPASSTWLYYCVFPQMPCRVRDTRDVPVPQPNEPERLDATRGLGVIDMWLARGGPSPAVIFGAEGRARLRAQRGAWRLFERATPAVPPTPVYFPR